MRLAKGFDQSIRMSVVSVSRPDKGRCAVVLSSTRYLAQTTLLRHQAADAVLHTYEGLRMPSDALRVSEGRYRRVLCGRRERLLPADRAGISGGGLRAGEARRGRAGHTDPALRRSGHRHLRPASRRQGHSVNNRQRQGGTYHVQHTSIRENIAAIRAEIDAAARETGRTGADITLVGASKMNDAETCQEAIAAGIDALGENRVQEMTAKLAQNAYGAPLHFIGHLQRNKVKQVVGKVALIQSIGSPELLAEVDKQAEKLGIVQDILLEVNIGGEAAKSGFAPGRGGAGGGAGQDPCPRPGAGTDDHTPGGRHTGRKIWRILKKVRALIC